MQRQISRLLCHMPRGPDLSGSVHFRSKAMYLEIDILANKNSARAVSRDCQSGVVNAGSVSRWLGRAAWTRSPEGPQMKPEFGLLRCFCASETSKGQPRAQTPCVSSLYVRALGAAVLGLAPFACARSTRSLRLRARVDGDGTHGRDVPFLDHAVRRHHHARALCGVVGHDDVAVLARCHADRHLPAEVGASTVDRHAGGGTTAEGQRVACREEVRHGRLAGLAAPLHHVRDGRTPVLADPALSAWPLAAVHLAVGAMDGRSGGARCSVGVVEVVRAHDPWVAIRVGEHEDVGQGVEVTVLVGQRRLAVPLRVMVVQEDHGLVRWHQTPAFAKGLQVTAELTRVHKLRR
mmetsp:Transcript_3106/g.8118  ORF Transcript_3106/g.8118 Transcript_3106/m.8118 type:complete len:349 (+) Transcript_3106:29-1075(+)